MIRQPQLRHINRQGLLLLKKTKTRLAVIHDDLLPFNKTLTPNEEAILIKTVMPSQQSHLTAVKVCAQLDDASQNDAKTCNKMPPLHETQQIVAIMTGMYVKTSTNHTVSV
jgi:hypothetical protein